MCCPNTTLAYQTCRDPWGCVSSGFWYLCTHPLETFILLKRIICTLEQKFLTSRVSFSERLLKLSRLLMKKYLNTSLLSALERELRCPWPSFTTATQSFYIYFNATFVSLQFLAVKVWINGSWHRLSHNHHGVPSGSCHHSDCYKSWLSLQRFHREL